MLSLAAPLSVVGPTPGVEPFGNAIVECVVGGSVNCKEDGWLAEGFRRKRCQFEEVLEW